MVMLRQGLAGLRVLLALTVVLGLGYPLLITGLGQLAMPHQANGSLVHADGRVVGSALLGQEFRGSGWFQARPSAAGSGYDALASGGSNLGPNSPDLLARVRDDRAAVAAAGGVPPSRVPPDAVTASASGLDPDISPAYAALQVDRVARARGLPPGVVRRLVAEHTSGRVLGFLGEPRVNVLALNLAVVQAVRATRAR